MDNENFDMKAEYPEFGKWIIAVTFTDAIRKGVGALLMSDNNYDADSINSLLASANEYNQLASGYENDAKKRMAQSAPGDVK